MHELVVHRVENGFIVTENPGPNYSLSRRWAFESAEALGEFMLLWGEALEDVTIKEEKDNV
jgi:hypothetical protein